MPATLSWRTMGIVIVLILVLLVVGGAGLWCFHWIVEQQRNPWFKRYPRLHAAAQAGDKEEVLRLIAKGEDVNEYVPWPSTPLYQAALRGHMEVAKLLIEHGAKVNPFPPGENSLHVPTPLDGAIRRGHKDIVVMLLDHGADPNLYLPLGVAAQSDEPEIAALLIQRGADVNGRDSSGSTALNWASSSSLAVTRLLLAAGAQVNVKNCNGDTSLTHACTYRHERNMDIVQLLIQNGAEVNVVNNEGETALTLARKNNLMDVVDFLLKSGVKN